MIPKFLCPELLVDKNSPHAAKHLHRRMIFEYAAELP